MKRFTLLLILLAFECIVYAKDITYPHFTTENRIFSATSNEFIGSERFLNELLYSDIVILGEKHDNPSHHDNQLAIMKAISNYSPISVGLEFISWTEQDLFDKYLRGELEEEAFLEAINWGSIPFSFYKPLVETAISSGGSAYGINAPSWLTHKIARKGLNSLSDEDALYLPPDFTLGTELYFQRFKEVMENFNHPLPELTLRNFFAAHSVWDDSMAFHTLNNNRKSGPFFIIVGNFHVEYKLGLPDRLKNRTNENYTITSIVQVDATDMSEEEILEFTLPHEDYGMAGDYIIFSF